MGRVTETPVQDSRGSTTLTSTSAGASTSTTCSSSKEQSSSCSSTSSSSEEHESFGTSTSKSSSKMLNPHASEFVPGQSSSLCWGSAAGSWTVVSETTSAQTRSVCSTTTTSSHYSPAGVLVGGPLPQTATLQCSMTAAAGATAASITRSSDDSARTPLFHSANIGAVPSPMTIVGINPATPSSAVLHEGNKTSTSSTDLRAPLVVRPRGGSCQVFINGNDCSSDKTIGALGAGGLVGGTRAQQHVYVGEAHFGFIQDVHKLGSNFHSPNETTSDFSDEGAGPKNLKSSDLRQDRQQLLSGLDRFLDDCLSDSSAEEESSDESDKQSDDGLLDHHSDEKGVDFSESDESAAVAVKILEQPAVRARGAPPTTLVSSSTTPSPTTAGEGVEDCTGGDTRRTSAAPAQQTSRNQQLLIKQNLQQHVVPGAPAASPALVCLHCSPETKQELRKVLDYFHEDGNEEDFLRDYMRLRIAETREVVAAMLLIGGEDSRRAARVVAAML